MTDTQLQQLIIYIGTTLQINAAIQAGTITENDFVISTDAPDFQEKLTQVQMDAVNSGITTQLVSLYNTHVADTTIHVTAQDKTTWNGKQNALNDAQLNAVNSGITSTDVAQITTNKNTISTETTNRQNADNNLQSQIDAITASSDVTDVVGTYAQLQAYDTSSLPPNSIIKVLQDENHNGEITYYRWVITGGTGSWVLIGEEGPYYTKSQADGRFATAAQGAKADSAVQSVVIGNTNGTLSVDGTDVPVKGLGSAAYTSSSDYWTVGQYGGNYDLQETYSAKRIEYMPNEDGQDFGLSVVSTKPDLEYVPYSGTWNGRMLVGNVNRTFLLGTATSNGSTEADMCCIGAHIWSPNLAWEDIYFNTDGDKTVYIGGRDWVKNSGWMKVSNDGNSTAAYRTYINTGTSYVPTWSVVLPNQATGTNSVLIKNNVSSTFSYSYSTSINGTCTANYGSSFGYNSSAGNYATALGSNATASASYSIQIGYGTNTEPNSLYVGTSASNNWKLLDSDGKIPDARLNSPVPDQTGNAGKFLTTDGSNTSWGSVPTITFYWGE